MFLFDEETKPQCLLEAKAPLSSMHVYLKFSLIENCLSQVRLIMFGIVGFVVLLCCCTSCCIGLCIYMIKRCYSKREDDPYPNVSYVSL